MYLHPCSIYTKFIQFHQNTFNIFYKYKVDKRNANDVIVKLMDLGVSSLNGTTNDAINRKDLSSAPLSITTVNYKNCDGNQNDDSEEKGNSLTN